MPVTEADVFNACATDKKRLTRWDERKYKEVWLAFCKWIVERFEKGKGVNIVYLMRLSWMRDEMEKEVYKTSSDVVLRPVFRLAEGFEKCHRLALKNKTDKATAADVQFMAKAEEVNFHKLAMRYSTSLSKDCVFSCLRQIILCMGNMMSRGMNLRVFCGVGDLCCSDKQVHFEFDSHYHRFIMRKTDLEPSISIKSIMEEVDALESGNAPSRNRDVLEIDPDGEEDDQVMDMEGHYEQDEEGFEMSEVLDEDGNVIFPRAKTSATEPRARTSASFRLPTSGGIRPARTVPRVETPTLLRGKTPAKLVPIYMGAQNEDPSILRKVEIQEGKNKVVRDLMWKYNEKKLEHDSQFQTRNLLLGEQRRQQAEEEQRRKTEKKQQYTLSLASTQKEEVDLRDEKKRIERARRMAEAKEDPFFVHLEPDPDEVRKKKKQEQEHFRQNLEQQIALRIKTASSIRSSDRKFDRQVIAEDQAGLLASLQELTLRKTIRDKQIKLEWSRQVEARNAAKKMEQSINKCFQLPDSSKEKLRQSVPFQIPRRPSTSYVIPPQQRSLESLRPSGSSQANGKKNIKS